ncbi:hypothetical protein [Flavobacterium sedimenticola]|uniref:Outer membrane protein beta-barrel domain-containing protein n=1 Tax=Flavobacterium sedimenticola TaxID=3043286 RepID=A0ABT6XSF5_9FLAO|nr:hypothetical protein [Flavobacterium sedimenticola]MDI9257902.1 hypothetical protein [Flavobacterium sedimenticola]
MKRFIFIFFISFISLSNGQENTNGNNSQQSREMQFSFRQKIGFSTLKLDNFEPIEGNLVQFDLMLSNSIAKKISLDYGLRISSFRANFIKDGQQSGVKNISFALPVGIIYVKDLNQNVSFIYGVHVYGSYLQSLEIGNFIDEEDLGINFGMDVQGGAVFKLNPKTDFAILIDFQGDLNKIKKDNLRLMHSNTALVSFNFSYKL